jgi:hypothetical protein
VLASPVPDDLSATGFRGPAVFASFGILRSPTRQDADCVRPEPGAQPPARPRPTQPHARAFAFSWSNSAWVIVPASRSCLADAI